VLLVVGSVPESRRSEVEGLYELAMEHIPLLLGAKNPDLKFAPLLARLTILAVSLMDLFSKGNSFREQWIGSDGMPPFARASAIWSAPILARENSELAFELFETYGRNSALEIRARFSVVEHADLARFGGRTMLRFRAIAPDR
jgi:hypothetical protein